MSGFGCNDRMNAVTTNLPTSFNMIGESPAMQEVLWLFKDVLSDE